MARRRIGRANAAGVLLLAAVGTGCTSQSPATQDSAPAPKRIAFFGFAKANSFAVATFTGIDHYAKAHGARADFLDGNFDAQAQARQIQDAVTAKTYDVFIVQANDGTVVQPAVTAAVAAGIPVVAEFTPLGSRYDTADPQIPGTITLVDVPTSNGRTLAELGIRACHAKNLHPCKIAYLEGMTALPLDNARTKAVQSALRAAGPDISLTADAEGGYTQQTGRQAMQDILQAHPDLDVVIGSSQAIAGAQAVTAGKSIAFIANGASKQAVDAVKQQRWFAAYYVPPTTMGAKAAELGLDKALGKPVNPANKATDLGVPGAVGTADTLKNITGEYDE
ncbi:sugar ABC transporter substrate-binding protein [Kitasatospora sp. NPDC059571]|uniref:sugar ABC transporter substrate-binding protein n=1 Tax=Kitasatospora sp. NPDC059571 TaxID=3346871 RepID=UPI003693BB4F